MDLGKHGSRRFAGLLSAGLLLLAICGVARAESIKIEDPGTHSYLYLSGDGTSGYGGICDRGIPTPFGSYFWGTGPAFDGGAESSCPDGPGQHDANPDVTIPPSGGVPDLNELVEQVQGQVQDVVDMIPPPPGTGGLGPQPCQSSTGADATCLYVTGLPANIGNFFVLGQDPSGGEGELGVCADTNNILPDLNVAGLVATNGYYFLHGPSHPDGALGTADCPGGTTTPPDTTPPDTQIDSGPAEGSTTTQTSAGFTYSGTPAADTDHFECKLDTGSFATCPSSGQSYSGLADGSHSFSVRAVDAAGNADQSPATRSWTVDTTPPDTQIDSGPAEGSTTTQTSAGFTYSGTPAADTDHFECKLDTGSFATCPSSGQSYSGLADGSHTFSVRAVDAAGNADQSPAARSWRVDTSAPDQDGDGSPDSSDNCPSVANPNQHDNDNDGVGDACDTFEDFDADGVEDGADNCPTTAGPASNNGCPEVSNDQDGDGVADSTDNCPTTAGPASNNGCPQVVLQPTPLTGNPVAQRKCVKKVRRIKGSKQRRKRCNRLHG